MLDSEVSAGAKDTPLTIGGKTFNSRLFTGTGKFASGALLRDAVLASGSEMVTMAVKRLDFQGQHDAILPALRDLPVTLLPNTSGARTAREAVFAANLAREALGTDFIKVEIHPDVRYLMPDPIETLKATEELAKQGFKVLAYCGADPMLCLRLARAGAAAVMPLGAPIGSNQGLTTRAMLKIIIAQKEAPIVVDDGIGLPSQAAEAMELGADAVLVNTAISVSRDPVSMARAFAGAVAAGRLAYLSGPGGVSEEAHATSPLEAFLKDLDGAKS